MPFDFSAAPALSAADLRRAALAAYAAGLDDPAADWKAIAAQLAAVVGPVKRQAKAPAPVQDQPAAAALEWMAYSPAQSRGKGGAFFPGRQAVFTFADGESVAVSIAHKMTLPAPDWQRAAACAVAFYKARRASRFLRLINCHNASESGQADARAYVNSCAVPPIVAGLDTTRQVQGDPVQCNTATADLREGPTYLSELLPYLQGQGDFPCYATAWRNAMAATYGAQERDKARKPHASAIEWQALLLARDAAAQAVQVRRYMGAAERLGGSWVFDLITARDLNAWAKAANDALVDLHHRSLDQVAA